MISNSNFKQVGQTDTFFFCVGRLMGYSCKEALVLGWPYHKKTKIIAKLIYNFDSNCHYTPILALKM